jgi:thermitase
VHLAAPGEGVLSTVPGGQFASWSGSSMATALVSGQVALVRGAFADWSPTRVVRRVVDTAAPVAGPVPRRADAAAAVGTSGTATAGAAQHVDRDDGDGGDDGDD